MNQTELAFTPAVEQAKLIRDRQISPLELVEIYLERIEKIDPKIGSYYYVAREEAITDAQVKTEQLTKIQDNTELPPFFGVPIGIKDLHNVNQMPCTYGVAALKDKISAYDEGIVTKVKQAGFVILGKTATSEVGSLPYTEPQGFLPTRNPWNLDYTPGGSSGGSAAAVAAGLCAIATASDGGGSIRGPAFCCGLVGLKPSRGRISNAPVGDYQSGIATQGGMARSVQDTAAFLDVVSGYIIGDPYWLGNPEISFYEAANRVPKKLKIAFASSFSPVGDAAEECRESVEKTAKLLSDMSHIVEPNCPDFSKLIKPFQKVWQAGVMATGISLNLLSPMNRWIAEQSGTAGEYLQAVTQMQVISREIVAFFEYYDVLLLPTYMHEPFKIGEEDASNPRENLEKIINWIFPCPPMNATGLPSIAIPTGLNKNGLPVGIQLVGKPTDELTIISLAAQLENIYGRLIINK